MQANTDHPTIRIRPLPDGGVAIGLGRGSVSEPPPGDPPSRPIPTPPFGVKAMRADELVGFEELPGGEQDFETQLGSARQLLEQHGDLDGAVIEVSTPEVTVEWFTAVVDLARRLELPIDIRFSIDA